MLGVNPWTLMTWMGHKTITETMRYVHVAASGGLKLIHCGGEKLIRPYVQWSPVYLFRPFSGWAAEGSSAG
jgi:hypothetical protein